MEKAAIAITLSQQTIKERIGGYKRILTEWANADGEHSTWWYKCATLPRYPEKIKYVYWVIKGRIRYRSLLVEVVKNKTMKFDGNPNLFENSNFLVLVDFEEIPRKQQIVMKGFQGFRYFGGI